MNEKNYKELTVFILCALVFLVLLCINPLITLFVVWIVFGLWDSLIH